MEHPVLVITYTSTVARPRHGVQLPLRDPLRGHLPAAPPQEPRPRGQQDQQSGQRNLQRPQGSYSIKNIMASYSFCHKSLKFCKWFYHYLEGFDYFYFIIALSMTSNTKPGASSTLSTFNQC